MHTQRSSSARLLFIIAVMSSFAVVTSASYSKNPDITLGSGEYAPYTGKDLPNGGSATKIVVEAFKAKGIITTMVWEPWARVYLDTQESLFFGSFPYVKTEERQAEMIYSDPVFTTGLYVISTPDVMRKIKIKSMDSFTGLTFCNPIGYALPVRLAPMVKAGKIKFISLSREETCQAMVARKHADFVVQLPSFFDDHQELKKDIVVSREPFDMLTFHLIASKSKPENVKIMAEFNEGLRLFKKTADYKKLAKDL